MSSSNSSRYSSDDFTSLEKPTDVPVDAVVASFYLNCLAFVVLMGTYECLRRLLPAVYSSQMKRQFMAGVRYPDDDEDDDEHEDDIVTSEIIDKTPSSDTSATAQRRRPRLSDYRGGASTSSLPDVISFYWVPSVFGVPWTKVRKIAGLDGYFFLRFIRMNIRICCVITFWALLVLVPCFSTGKDQNNKTGWYLLSLANLKSTSWRVWVPAVFAYFMTGFVFFVTKQEYRHFLELRMDFLARGTDKVHPQHHYSLKLENIPHELRSEKALCTYFDKLFPGKVHSASIVLNLPDLEAVKLRCLRICRKLEKSIAYFHATDKRPTHNVGSPRISIAGIDFAPFDCSCGAQPEVAYINERGEGSKPARGTHVDSISYYIHDLADSNREMYALQQRKAEIAVTGNSTMMADSWLARAVMSAYHIADRIMIDSAEDNELRANASSMDDMGSVIPQVERMPSLYGSIDSPTRSGTRKTHFLDRHEEHIHPDGPSPPTGPGYNSVDSLLETPQGEIKKRPGTRLSSINEDLDPPTAAYCLPGSTAHASVARRIAGRLGLDFIVTGIKFFNKQLDHALEGVTGATMSSTGFVTFLDLTTVTCAASTPLTTKPRILDVTVAPEPRDILWQNAHVSAKTRDRREQIVNFLLFLGVFFWIFPLAAIQAFAKADFIAAIPGMEWIKTFDGGSISSFMNGYLPVIALLILILILPVIFEFVATNYERRKTRSDVQKSMLSRYFYYQLANIYITVTAGSLWSQLAEILDHPQSGFELLGNALPSMVGYFIALLVTKILAGLPIVFLRVGALSRMLFLQAISSEGKLTQREIDEIYRPENIQYGWEFPSQLLVVVIVFTYAVICPVILPFGLMFFCGSMIVYKKQILYVYQPLYESGGVMFPSVLQRMLWGLACGQATLIGYLSSQGCSKQSLFLLPLPLFTIWGMGYFHRHYAIPSTKLSLERAREYDRVSEMLAKATRNKVENDPMSPRRSSSSGDGSISGESVVPYGMEARRMRFDKDSYRQPVLNQPAMVPRLYRRKRHDTLTMESRNKLRSIQEYALFTESVSGSASNL